MGSLDGKVAIVTGAGQGVGQGVAIAIAKAGAPVALVGRTQSKLDETKGMIEAAGGRAITLVGDIGHRATVNAMVAETEQKLGPVFILVNNAVSDASAPIEAISDENMELVLRSGVYGSLYFMQACFPTMKQHGGRIFNFGSGAATMGLESKGSYAIAKEGLRGLTKVAAVEWGQYGITVNTINPSVDSPLRRAHYASMSAEEQKKMMVLYPMRSIADAEIHVGGMIVFLSGPGGFAITSRTFHIDGGRAYYDR